MDGGEAQVRRAKGEGDGRNRKTSQAQEGEAQFGSGSAYQGQVPFKDRAGGSPQRGPVAPGS